VCIGNHRDATGAAGIDVSNGGDLQAVVGSQAHLTGVAGKNRGLHDHVGVGAPAAIWMLPSTAETPKPPAALESTVIVPAGPKTPSAVSLIAPVAAFPSAAAWLSNCTTEKLLMPEVMAVVTVAPPEVVAVSAGAFAPANVP